MTQIWYEVFVVTLVDGRVMLLQDRNRPAYSPWMLAHQPNVHPNSLVIEHLPGILNRQICTEKTIVHSTSWRYEASRDWMLLTYLAILHQSDGRAKVPGNQQITLEPVGIIAACHGDQLFPPTQIEHRHVLAHALDHLAALNIYDLSIQRILEAEWKAILYPRQPRPAGGMHRAEKLTEAATQIPPSAEMSLLARRE